MQGHLGGRGPQGTLRPLVSRLQGEAQGRAESRGVNVTPGPESAGGRGRPACSASAPLIPAGARACSHLSLEAMNALGTLLALAALFLPSVQAQEGKGVMGCVQSRVRHLSTFHDPETEPWACSAEPSLPEPLPSPRTPLAQPPLGPCFSESPITLWVSPSPLNPFLL